MTKNTNSEFSHIPKKFGRVLANLRKEQDMTQHDLQERSGLSLRMISDMERGQIQPSLITLFKLAKGLGFDVSDLIESLLKHLGGKYS